MFPNNSNESTRRRYTESSGFTTEEFEGDSWKSDSDFSEDAVSEEEEEDLLLNHDALPHLDAIANANNVEQPVGKKEEDSSTSQEDEDLEPYHPQEQTPTMAMEGDLHLPEQQPFITGHSTRDKQQDDKEEDEHVDEDHDEDDDEEDYHDDDSSQNEDQDLNSIHIEDDEDQQSVTDISSSSSNIVEVIQLPMADQEHNISISEHLDILRGENHEPHRRFARRTPFRSSSTSLSLQEMSKAEEVSLSSGRLPQPPPLPPAESMEEDLSKSTRQLDSEEEYLETSWLPINFDNHHSTGYHHFNHNEDADRNLPQQQQQHTRIDSSTTTKQDRHEHNRNQLPKNDYGRRRTRNPTSSSQVGATTTTTIINNNNNNNNDKKKTLSPSKQRRRYCLGISLLLFCIGTASVAFWFIFFYLDHNRMDAGGSNNAESQYSSSNANPEDGTVTNGETMIQPLDRPLSDDYPQCASFTVEVVTDMYGNETSWVLSYLIDRDKDLTSASYSEKKENVEEDVVFYERYISSPLESRGKRKRLRQHSTQFQREMSKKEQQQQQPLTDSQPSQSPQELPIGNGGPYMYLDTPSTVSHNSTYCLTKGSYKFIIYDVNGDGFCCRYGNGTYSLYFNGGRPVVQSTKFKDEQMESVEFEVTEDDILRAIVYSSASPSFSAVSPMASYPPSMTFFDHSSTSTKRMATASWSDLLSDVSKSYGLIFDIQTNRNISSLNIVGMELLVDATDYIHYEVWTMPGSWRELNTSESVAFYSSFSPVANGTMMGRGVCEDCGFSSIPLDDFQDVFIEGAKTVQSFWVTLASDSLVFKKHDASQVAQSSCDSFIVNVGSAVLVYPLESVEPTLDLNGENDFLGAIQYQSLFRDIAGTSLPTPSPLTLNSTESPSVSSSRSQSPASDKTTHPTYHTDTPTASNFTTTSLIPTILNTPTSVVNSSVFPSPGSTSNESPDNLTTIFGNNTSKINDTLSINASSPDIVNSSMAPTSVMSGNSTSAPSSSISPSTVPSYNDTVVADDDGRFKNWTIAWDDTASNLNYTLPINASNPYISHASVSPTSVIPENSTTAHTSSYSPSLWPSFNDTAMAHDDTITNDLADKMNHTDGFGGNNTSTIYNYSDTMNSAK